METARKMIVLTGASRGLGAALAREFVRLGHRVEGCARCRPCTDGLDFRLEAVDISDAVRVSQWAGNLLDRGGVPDILICNAAVINEPAPFWRVPGSVLREVITTNVLGTGYTVQAFVPTMISRGKGLIINVSSGWGRSVAAEMAPYCASKWAIEALTLSLARELPAGMAALTLNPGIVRTEMLRKCWPTQAEADYEMPDAWAKRAAQLILSLSAADNGRQVTVPPP